MSAEYKKGAKVRVTVDGSASRSCHCFIKGEIVEIIRTSVNSATCYSPRLGCSQSLYFSEFEQVEKKKFVATNGYAKFAREVLRVS